MTAMVRYEAERQLGAVVRLVGHAAQADGRTLRQALSLDGELSEEAREAYFARLPSREVHR
ncbi:hypothetical protein [Streptomyces sp. NPDC048637]|uniref:hypothetical protein n=1 Tax=Streptomyces sp. NPDC048637 TaxID=3155636 RepID=UPI003415545A